MLDYAGEVQYSYMLPQGTELWQVQFQPGVYPMPKITTQKVKEAVVEAAPQAYVPPHLRGKAAGAGFSSKLREDDEKPDTKLKVKSSEKKVLDEEGERQKKIKAIKKVSAKKGCEWVSFY